jgi:hypothetical protein
MVSNASARIRLIPLALACILFLAGCSSLYPPSPGTRGFNKYSCLDPEGSLESVFTKGTDAPQTDAQTLTDLKTACPDPFDPSDPRFATDVGLNDGVKCARTVRDIYGGFLLCRERDQIAYGLGIAGLAAGAAGVAAAGISAVAAASLGATAGAGLGFDYLIYSKDKTKAYADATTQLQCIVGQAAPLMRIHLEDSDLPDGLLANPPACIGNKSDVYLARAQYAILQSRSRYFKDRFDLAGLDILSTVQTIGVRTFTASQSGVPDADQIQKAAQSVTSLMPKAPSAPSAAKGPSGAAKGPSAAIALPSCSDLLTGAKDKISALNESLAEVKLPKPGFPECLALSAFSSAAPTSKSTSSAKPTPSAKPSPASKPSPAASPADGTADKPSAGDTSSPQKSQTIVFGAAPTSNVVNVDKDTSSATVKIVGGTPPYYAVAVDPGVGVTDLFGTFEVTLNPVAVGEYRVLIGDQAGADIVMFVKPPKPPAKKPDSPPKSSCCGCLAVLTPCEKTANTPAGDSAAPPTP